jgi:hypothetical protein
VVAEAGDGLGFAAHALHAVGGEALDHCDGDVAVEAGVAGEIDLLYAVAAEEGAYVVETASEGVG